MKPNILAKTFNCAGLPLGASISHLEDGPLPSAETLIEAYAEKTAFKQHQLRFDHD